MPIITFCSKKIHHNDTPHPTWDQITDPPWLHRIKLLDAIAQGFHVSALPRLHLRAPAISNPAVSSCRTTRRSVGQWKAMKVSTGSWTNEKAKLKSTGNCNLEISSDTKPKQNLHDFGFQLLIFQGVSFVIGEFNGRIIKIKQTYSYHSKAVSRSS